MKEEIDIETFLVRLIHLTKRKRLKWKVGADGAIRCASGFCPITAFTKEDPSNYEHAAAEIGLREGEAEEIVGAADNPDEELRGKLEKACGIA